MRIVFILLSALTFSTVSIAAIDLKITCTVDESTELDDTTSEVSKAMHFASHSSDDEPLKIDIYGGNVSVRTYLSPRKDNSACEYKHALICLNSGNTDMCQDDEVRFYPKDGQVGEWINVTCKLSGELVKRCEF